MQAVNYSPLAASTCAPLIQLDKNGVNCTVANYFYGTPEPWPTARFEIRVQRASFYYSLSIVAPTIILTVSSFGVFFMSFEIGERLGYGITLVLAVQVMQITVNEMVPGQLESTSFEPCTTRAHARRSAAAPPARSRWLPAVAGGAATVATHTPDVLQKPLLRHVPPVNRQLTVCGAVKP